MKLPVTDDGRRPAGKPDECFYCKAKEGHKDDCVCVKKAVTMEVNMTVTIAVPDNWDADQIEFFFNDGTWCTQNLFDELSRREICKCWDTKMKYVRDTTEQDVKDFGPVLGHEEEE